MTETATESTQKEELLIQPFNVERNGEQAQFSQFKITRGKGDSKGTYYPCIEVSEENLPAVEKWIGTAARKQIIQSFLRRISQGWNKEAVKKGQGEFNQNEFSQLAAAFSVMGEGIKVLQERLNSLNFEFKKYDLNKLNALMSQPDDAPEKHAFVELMKRIQEVTTALENKKRDKTEAEVEEEDKDQEPVSAV